MPKFDPNGLTFAQGVERLKKAASEAGIKSDRIFTSRDPTVREAVAQLRTGNVPDGFSKSQLPFFQDGPTQFFVSVGAPDSEVPRHSHDEGDGVRIILSGSIEYDGKELHAGDWMFIPKGRAYSFRVGSSGVHMFYCYQCCCA